ncbi:hypothetical protein Tco_0524869 [Tanacetum coccineum]
MHNNIMAAGSKDRPPMLGPGRYSQWRSRFLRYLDTKSNGEYLRKCIFDGPYMPTNVLIAAVEAAENILPVAAHEEAETIHNMTAENKLYFQAEKEAIFLILTGIGDEIYSTPEVQSIALLTAAQPYSVTTIRHPKPQKIGMHHTYMQSSSTRPSADYQKQRQKRSPNQLSQSEPVSEETLYKPTNNNLQTSSNSRNKIEDTTPRKPKRVKDYAYHKEKMMMCKQAEQGVPLQAEQADWLEDTDEEIDEQELEAHYSYMAKIQEVSPEESSSTSQPLEQVQNHDENDVFANVRRHSEQPESINDTYVLEKDDSNVIPDSSNICTNDNQVDQNATACVDERAALANLIANLTLDTEENKTILKQLKKANASLTQELKECKTNLDESSRALGEATSSRDSSLIALQTKQTELEKYTA